MDADTWWHLAAGRALLAGRPDAFRESWSFTAAGRPWLNHEWLAEALLAGARSAAGDAGLCALALLLLGLTVLLLLRTARREGLSPAASAALLALAAAAAGDRFLPRPQLFTYLGLALVFDRVSAARRARRCPWELVAVLALWSNAHGAVVGLGVLALLIAGGALPHLSLAARARFGLALVAAACVHPQGPAPLLDNIQQLAAGGLYRQTVREWLPLLDPGQAGLPQRPATLFLSAIGLAAGACGLATARRGGAAYALLLLGVGVAPFTAVRHRDLLALVSLPAVAALPALTTWRPRGPAPAATGWALAVALLVVPTAGLAGYPRARIHPGLSSAGAPAAAVDYLAREPVGQRVFNVYDQGGYLIERLAPGRRVFIDGRYFVYGEALYRDYLEIRDAAPDARERLGRYGADLLFLRYPARDGYMALAREAATWNEWHLVFWDDETLVYARDGAASPAWMTAHAYSLAHPLVTAAHAGDAAWWTAAGPGIVREAWRAVGDAPRAVRPRLTLAMALEALGRTGDARRVYGEILERHPESRPARDALHRMAPPIGPGDEASESGMRQAFGLPPHLTPPVK